MDNAGTEEVEGNSGVGGGVNKLVQSPGEAEAIQQNAKALQDEVAFCYEGINYMKEST